MYSGGEGSINNPFIIKNAKDLNDVRHNLSAHFKQLKHIDLKEYDNWEPIQNFSGFYDGGGFVIKNLTITVPLHTENGLEEIPALGLFGVAENAVFRDITIDGKLLAVFEVSTNSHGFGLLVGTAKHSSFEYCRCNGEVITNRSEAGGLIGYTDGISIVDKCTSSAVVMGTLSVGGLLGEARCYDNGGFTTVSNCYATGDVYGFMHTGGLLGNAQSGAMKHLIINSYSSGAMYGYDPANMGRGVWNGGLCGGLQNAEVENCYSLKNEYHTNGVPMMMCDLIACGNTKNSFYLSPSINEWGVGANSGTNISDSSAKTRKHYENNSWDFNSIWEIKEGESFPTFKLKRIVKKCVRRPIPNYRWKTVD